MCSILRVTSFQNFINRTPSEAIEFPISFSGYGDGPPLTAFESIGPVYHHQNE